MAVSRRCILRLFAIIGAYNALFVTDWLLFDYASSRGSQSSDLGLFTNKTTEFVLDDELKLRAVPVHVPNIDYKTFILEKNPCVCLLRKTGLGSQMMNLMAQKILCADWNRSFIADDTVYGYKRDNKTGVLLGYFTPQFPVFKEEEWDQIIHEEFHKPPLKRMARGKKNLTIESEHLLLMWATSRPMRESFLNLYGTNGSKLYNLFATEACENFQFNQQTLQDIDTLKAVHGLPNLRQSNSVAFHVRRGDKLIAESQLYPGESYVKKLLAIPDRGTLEHCYVASDDVGAVLEVKQSLKDHKIPCQVHTIATEQNLGRHATKFSYNEKAGTIHFLTEFSMLLDATFFIGTFNSNVASFAAVLRKCHNTKAPHYAHSYGVDEENWFYSLRTPRSSQLNALGDFEVELPKPLGLILEERDDGAGAYVKQLGSEGSAASASQIAPQDILLKVDGTETSDLGFDSIMELLVEAPSPVRLTLGDGLGQLDMPKNVVRMLKSTEDAYTVDAVVRQAVREVRRRQSLGDLMQVEVVVGAGVQADADDDDATRVCKVRFFAIFSTDGGVSTYSCNVAATAAVVTGDDGDESITLTALSCAKDEGLGQTYDLI